MQTIFFDLRFALRQLRKSAGFTTVAILMLAFAIGATTAIFSIVESVLLRPLPFPDSARLMVLADRIEGVNVGGNGEAGVSVQDILHYSRDTKSFAALGAHQGAGFELSGNTEPARISAERMTAGLFAALGIVPELGRVFTAEEVEHSQQVAVLSYATWRSRFHGDPQILGKKILLDRKPFVVIGVMPRNFEYPLNPGQLNRTELWVPLSFSATELASNRAGNWSYQMEGRLKPGVSPAQAQQDAARVAQDIMRNFPPNLASLRIDPVVRPLQEETVEASRPLLRTLFLAVAVVLLIACANLAGLMLVRAIRRQREMAVRLALGATASTLLRQTILESLVVSVAAGLFGLALAAAVLRLGRSLLPESLPRIAEISLNWKVVAFALLLAVFTGLLCSLAPAFAALRTNVNSALKEGGRSGTTGGSHARLRSGLVVAEIAVALVLLTASGLLLRSFDKMRMVDIGYRPEHLTTAGYALPGKQYATQTAVTSFTKELLLRLRQLPGVESAGFSSYLPASGNNNNQVFVVDGYVPPKGADMNLATIWTVMGDSFRALGIPLVRGRFFSDADTAETQLVVIVNHKLADHYWPGQNPIGKRMRIGTQEMDTPWLTVVGEVADVKLNSPDEPSKQQYFLPVDQMEKVLGSLAAPDDLNLDSGNIVVRSALPAEQIENPLRAAVRSIDPQLALTRVQTMEEAVSESEAPRRFNTIVIGSFAFAAVLLAVLGIYSVIAFSVASRVQEMAIRLALGSPRDHIIRLVLQSGAILAGIGCVLGLAFAAAASTLLSSLLFEVSPFDPLVLVVAAFAVLLLAMAASALPALRAASTDPMQALRNE
ncbi:MAG: ABC transporter permease [Acidobacteriaceae bacterium]